jgi:hypothetical protein
MFRRCIAAAVLTLFVAAPAVANSISISFEEFAHGVAIGDYHNGGKDSLGRAAGIDYGLTFNSGTIRHTTLGAYLSGRVELTIDVAKVTALLGTDNYYISFNGARHDIDGGPTFFGTDSGHRDAQWIAGNGNPFCSGIALCNDGFYGRMDGYRLYAGTGVGSISGISFTTDRLDNLQIHAYDGSAFIVPGLIPGSVVANRDIPEPASMALLGIGAVALLARRRRR